MADLSSNDSGPDPGISRVCFGIAGVCAALGAFGVAAGGAVPAARDLSGLLVVAGIYAIHALTTWPRGARVGRSASGIESGRAPSATMEKPERQVA